VSVKACPFVLQNNANTVPRHAFNGAFTVRISDRRFGADVFILTEIRTQSGTHTADVSRISTETRVCECGTRENLLHSVGWHIVVFQGEGCALKACTSQNIDKDYENRSICMGIVWGSSAVIRGLNNSQISFNLVSNSHQSVKKHAICMYGWWDFFLLKSWVTQNFITIKTSWNTNG
jgi:hypothetical protein